MNKIIILIWVIARHFHKNGAQFNGVKCRIQNGHHFIVFSKSMPAVLKLLVETYSFYDMASAVSGQYVANSVFWLATWAGKMERYCLPGTARFVPANKILPTFKLVQESFLLPKLFSAKVKKIFVFSLSLWNQKKRQRKKTKMLMSLQQKPANMIVCFEF